MIDAHIQHLTLRIVEHIPQHEVRAHDPHYHWFNATKARLQKLGALKCWVGNADCFGQIELHHDKAEFCLLNSIDKTKFIEAFPTLFPEFHPDTLTDEQFLKVVEEEGNLTPLCHIHHTGILGVHVLPYPLWLPQKFVKAGMRPAEIAKV